MTAQSGLFQDNTQSPTSEPKTSKTSTKWKDILKEEFEAPYFKKLKQFVRGEREAGKTIYPSDQEVFNALKYTSFNNVRVVILGQDPYHGPNQAHGLCFSVKPGIRFPPSLLNIFKELNSDLNISMPPYGTLTKWAKQGVLLLNAVLTVQASQAASHQNKGWERFTDRVVEILNEKKDGLIFVLWGSHAQKKGSIINPTKHHILKAPHPSPLSAHRGFFGCKHFSQINSILENAGQQPINWDLTA